MDRRRLVAVLAVACLSATGCKKDDKGSGEGGAGKTDPSAETETPKSPPPDAAPVVLTRLFQCDFVGWEGEGAERQAKFALTNKGTEPVKRIQSWIYYYKGGDQIDRYPHALSDTFEPGVKKEVKLGSKGDRIKSSVDGTGCEITEATYTSGAKWNNDNLNYNRLMIPRPLEGETHEQLLARTGVKVATTWAGNKGGSAMFSLENQSGRPLTAHTAWVYYYDADGKQLGRAVSNLRLEIAAGAKVDQELGYKSDKIPEETEVIEATISKVVFNDGDKETWINRNLAPFERPMVAAPKAAPAGDAPAPDAGQKAE